MARKTGQEQVELRLDSGSLLRLAWTRESLPDILARVGIAIQRECERRQAFPVAQVTAEGVTQAEPNMNPSCAYALRASPGTVLVDGACAKEGCPLETRLQRMVQLGLEREIALLPMLPKNETD